MPLYAPGFILTRLCHLPFALCHLTCSSALKKQVKMQMAKVKGQKSNASNSPATSGQLAEKPHTEDKGRGCASNRRNRYRMNGHRSKRPAGHIVLPVLRAQVSVV